MKMKDTKSTELFFDRTEIRVMIEDYLKTMNPIPEIPDDVKVKLELDESGVYLTWNVEEEKTR